MSRSGTRPILLTNARVIDPSRDLDQPGDVLIADGAIREAGKNIRAAGIPEGAEIVECNGHVVAPGLIDMRAFIGDVPGGICSPSTVLPMQIFLWSDEVDRGFVEKTSAAIIVLLIVLLSMNAFAIYLRNKFEKRW